MAKMNPAVKKKWVAALRSGEYEQGRELLREGNRFCCLGVLCDLHAKQTKRAWEGSSYGGFYLPPSKVVRWAGLPNENPLVGKRELSVHNDGCGAGGAGGPVKRKSFKQIAALIDEYL